MHRKYMEESYFKPVTVTTVYRGTEGGYLTLCPFIYLNYLYSFKVIYVFHNSKNVEFAK